MKLECPDCGRIELAEIRPGEYECPCGHKLCVSDSPQKWNKFPGFHDWINSFGMDELDNLGPLDQMRAAFNGGRLFEALQNLKHEKELET